MEKLFNWTIGSFFRTIGRLIAYFAIGAFIAYILGHSNIDLGGITNLFYTKVNASSNKAIWPENIKYAINTPTTWNNGTQGVDDYWSNLFSLNGQERYFYKFDTITLDNNADILYVNIKMKINSVDSYDLSLTESQYKCTITNEDVYFSTQHDYEIQQDYFICQQHNTSGYIDLYQHKFNLTLMYYYNDNTNLARSCQAIGQAGGIYSFQCPITSNNISGFRINVQTNMLTGFDLGFSPFITYTVNGTQSSIENQTQQQQQQHNETMTIVTDTNTTQEQNETTTFFEDFQFSSDSTGLVGVITAPLRVFTAISEGTFSDLCFTLKGKQTCFPNGNMIWQKTERTSSFFGSGSIATGIQAFVTLFNLVAGGYLLYKMGASVKRLTEELIDPRNTRIEVMKL